MVNQSKAGLQRQRWFEFYREHGENGRLTCRHFGISPQTFYRWKRRFQRGELKELEDRSRRPRRRRQRTWTLEDEAAVRGVRERYPAWGKQKLRVLLQREGIRLSESMVGRILDRLKRTGRLHEPVSHRPRRGKPHRRPYAVRKPREYQVTQAGDLVQVDTKVLNLYPGRSYKQFTARDCISRWDVLHAFSAATARTAAVFLDILVKRCPFPVRAIQIDGGSEFKGEFEDACKNKGILLFVLPPRSPKLNGRVERANRTHDEEFHHFQDLSINLFHLNRGLLAQELTYNTIRPHQALGLMTPSEFLAIHAPPRKENVSPMY